MVAQRVSVEVDGESCFSKLYWAHGEQSSTLGFWPNLIPTHHINEVTVEIDRASILMLITSTSETTLEVCLFAILAAGTQNVLDEFSPGLPNGC